MLIKPRPGFEFPLAIVDAVNPFLVLLSIVGLFLEYTPLKVWVIPVNQVIDILFVVDFVVRMVCFPTGKYIFHGYGWVDFLASLPGLTLLISYTPMFATFKFLRIGRFFKVIRLLRFLRVFSFLKKMKDDSIWIQDKVMKIGITVVLVFVVGLFLVDSLGLGYLTDLKSRYYTQRYYDLGRDPAKLAAADRDVLFFTQGGQIFDRQGKPVDAAGARAYDAAVNDDVHLSLEIALSPDSLTNAAGQKVPVTGIVVAAPDVEIDHDNLMLVLVSTLVVLLVLIIFYVGTLFAKDMRIVQLIIDSADADDFLLLNEEARALQDAEGQLVLEEGEDEIRGLLKMVGKLTLEREASSSFGYGAEPSGPSPDLAAIEDRLARIEALLDDSRTEDLVKRASLQAVKSAVPSVVNYLKEKFPGLG
jgi:hypothetical protein